MLRNCLETRLFFAEEGFGFEKRVISDSEAVGFVANSLEEFEEVGGLGKVNRSAVGENNGFKLLGEADERDPGRGE